MTHNVLHVDTERGWRGGERQTLWLARELAARGVGTVVAARRGEPLAARAREAHLSVLECAPRSEVDPLAALALRRAIRANGITIVHAHTAHAATLGALATIGTDAALVIARRVDFPLRGNAVTRWKYRRAAAVIAVSRAVARVVQRSPIDPSRVHVVPDGVDVHRRVAPASRGVLESLGVRAGAPLVVQVGQLVGHKDPLNFVRAAARARESVPGLQALLVGDGPLRGDVTREVDALGLRGTLHVAGYRTDADALLAAADVVTLSSSEEGMGSVLLDALAFARPIAATRAGGIPEVVEEGVSGLLAPARDPAALGDAIARLATDRSLAVALSAAAASRAQEFSVERMADRTLEIYDAVARERAGASRASVPNASSSPSVTGAP